MKKITLGIKKHWILITILLFSATIRFYRLEEMASYDFDQEYVSRFVLEVVNIYPIKYIGQGLSVMGLFMGPFYFYFLVPFYLLFNMNPLGGFVASVLLGLVNVFLYYIVAKKIFNSKTSGLFAAFIRGFGFYAISNDWSMVPSYSSDIMVLLVAYLLFIIWKQKKKFSSSLKKIDFWILPTLFLIFGSFTSLHPIQFPLILVSIVLLFIWKKRFPIKQWLTSILAFFIPILPLIYFDYLRKWSMVNQIFGMFFGDNVASKSQILGLPKVIKNLKSINVLFRDLLTIERHHHFSSIYILLLIWIILFFLVKTYQKKRFRFHTSLVLVSYITVFLYYSLFPTHVPEYYLLSLQTIMVLYASFGLSILFKKGLFGKILASLAILVFSFNSGTRILEFWQEKKPMKLINKQTIVRHIIEKADGKPFKISYVTEPGSQFGFDSLFEIEGTVPTNKGPVYTIISPKTFTNNPNEIHFESGGVGVKYPD